MFPKHEATIRATILRSVNPHGREVFGPHAADRIQEVNAETSMKLLVQLLQQRSGPAPSAATALVYFLVL